jgi:hypothetical protein
LVWIYKSVSSHKLGLINHLVSLHIEAREKEKEYIKGKRGASLKD